jgi:ABC-type Mn2+/Zn2+ transport system permease subunit
MKHVISHQDLLVFIGLLVITFLCAFFLRRYIEKNKIKKWVRINKEKSTEKTYHLSAESQLKAVDIQDDVFFGYFLEIFFSFGLLIVYIVSTSAGVSKYLTPDGFIVLLCVSIAIICCIIFANKIAHRLYKHIYKD